MLRLIKGLALFFIIILPVLAVATVNRHDVELILDPFAPHNPALSVSLPLFIYLFSSLILGLVLGGIATWLSQGKWRRNAKKAAREANRWRLEADQLKRQLETTDQRKLPSLASS